MYTLAEILCILNNKEMLEDRAAYSGNFSLIDSIIDAERIVKKAGLTERQEILFNMYVRTDLTLAKVGELVGITHQGVADSINQSKKKIQKVIEEEEV